jgi:DNA-3-methyladenine glycosylase
MSETLPRSFFQQDTNIAARCLLGARLVRILDGQRISGLIVEVEAYNGEQDLACHARVGRTSRNAVMYGPPGHAYIYFTYGMHWCLNAVTREEGFPAAILLRAIHPLEGLEHIARHRPGRPPAEWCNGPAKLCQALRLDGSLNGCDLCDEHGPLFIEMGAQVSGGMIRTSARIGIGSVPEPWRSKPWRYFLKNMTA